MKADISNWDTLIGCMISSTLEYRFRRSSRFVRCEKDPGKDPDFPAVEASNKFSRDSFKVTSAFRENSTHSIITPNPFNSIFFCSSFPKMSFANLMSGAECSTSTNPLNQFTKHVGQDKSVQQDRFVPGVGPNQGMRGDIHISPQDRLVSILEMRLM